MGQARSPLVNGKTFITVKRTLTDIHGAVKLHNPTKKAAKHFKQHMYPGYSKNYTVPIGF